MERKGKGKERIRGRIRVRRTLFSPAHGDGADNVGESNGFEEHEQNDGSEKSP